LTGKIAAGKRDIRVKESLLLSRKSNSADHIAMAHQKEDKSFSVKFSAISETLEPEFRQNFPFYDEKGLFRGEPGGFVLTETYGERAEEVYNFEPRPDDAWVVTFPKCGRTSSLNHFIYFNIIE
jgi:hypothetical protein